MKFEYEITFEGENLIYDKEVGQLTSFETLTGEAESEDNPVISRTYTRLLTVKPANLHMSVKREQMLYDFQKREEQKIKDGIEIDVVMQVLETAYFPLAACSLGDIPTFEEFAYVMGDDVAEAWGSLVRSINPHWWGQEKKRT